MIPGGIADKLGNRYEAKWLVRNLLFVIANKANWLKFEGIETDYQGFEFALQRGQTIEWHQTKVNAPMGNWTLTALKNEGVLRAFKYRFSHSQNSHCFFVSQDNAKDLRTLSDKARLANDFSQYDFTLSNDQKEKFKRLLSEWNCNEEMGLDWLKRSHVEVLPEKELDSLIESFGDLYFQLGGNSVFPALREILENNFNKKITSGIAREAIKSQGTLTIKEWSLDPTILESLRIETDAYLTSYTPFGVGGSIIHRSQTSEVVEELLKPDGADLILLTGVAGTGKSGVIREVIENLKRHEIQHLAFRVDRFLTCLTRQDLGVKITGRNESPVSTLKGIAPDNTAVLIVDQLDAISEVSGRDGQVKEVIFRLIQDAQYFGGVRVIVACKTFDLENDPRIKGLKESDRTKQIEVPLLNWDEDVFPLFKEKGIGVSDFSETQRSLLCSPINLAIFFEIGEPEFNFQSRTALYAKLIENKQRKLVRERKPSWGLIEPLVEICKWMSDRQKLNAPVYILDGFPGAIDALSSEGLIVKSREQVNFLHESFFDYVYARSFHSTSHSLIDLLTSTEQHLFRRTQVRQILETLRQGDYQGYLDELKNVLTSDQVRFHVKVAVSQWLSSIEEPTSQEFAIVIALDNPTNSYSQIVRHSLLSTHNWFDILLKNGWIQEHLYGQNQQRKEYILAWLSKIAGERPEEIAILLREWWGDIPERAEKLMNWFGYMKRKKADQSLMKLCDKIIKSHPANLFSGAGGGAFSMVLHTLEEKNCEFNGEILHSLFDAWYEMNPGRNVFNRDELEKMQTHSLGDLAQKGPQTFLKGTTDALNRSINMVIAEGPSGTNWFNFNRRTYSGHRSGFDQFLGIYRSALQALARCDPEKASEYLKKLDFTKHRCFMHLHLETIQVNPQALGSRLVDLASAPLVFEAGWNGAEWFSFATAAREIFPYLQEQDREKVESRVLEHCPEIKWARETLSRMADEDASQLYRPPSRQDILRILNRSGYEEWCILETIGERNLGKQSMTRLRELRRKFPTSSVAKPTHLEGGIVGSPIKSSHCEYMKDKHWLSAIGQYNNEESPERERSHFFIGGANELARELQKAAKKDPQRFSALTLSIPLNAHPSYIQHILWGLAESDEPPETCLAQAIRHAHMHPDKPFGADIARLIENHPDVAQDGEILEILLWYAEHGEANLNDAVDELNTQKQSITIRDLLYEGQSFKLRGQDVARGWACEALGSVVWEVPCAKERVWEFLERALTREELISIRCCMMRPLAPLFNDDKNRFTKMIRNIITLPEGSSKAHLPIRLSPLITLEGVRLFLYIFRLLPKLGDELVSSLLNSGEKKMELVGAWLIFYESHRNEAYIERADALTNLSLDHRRLMADVTADALKWTDNEDRHRTENLIIGFFFDEDEEVRKLSADVFRNIPPNEFENYRSLAGTFLRSPAYANNGFAILHILQVATCDVLDLVLEAAHQITADIAEKGDQGGRRSLDLHQLKDLLKREYVSSESRPESRKKILDLIDLMLLKELYGVESIVNVHER